MNTMSRIIGVLAVCGMVTSAHASFIILDNPHGLDLQAATADGINGWDWSSDTFGDAYANGQLDVSAQGIRAGAPENLVDGDGGTLGLIMYSGFTAEYALNASYNGPRALGTDDGQFEHAMRIGIDFHENWNDYNLEVYYQTTDAPGVWETLFKVQDLASDPAWKATAIFVVDDAASRTVDNISMIAIKSWEVTQSGGGIAGGGLTELDVHLIPEPATMALFGVAGIAALASRRFRI